MNVGNDDVNCSRQDPFVHFFSSSDWSFRFFTFRCRTMKEVHFALEDSSTLIDFAQQAREEIKSELLYCRYRNRQLKWNRQKVTDQKTRKRERNVIHSISICARRCNGAERCQADLLTISNKDANFIGIRKRGKRKQTLTNFINSHYRQSKWNDALSGQ